MTLSCRPGVLDCVFRVALLILLAVFVLLLTALTMNQFVAVCSSSGYLECCCSFSDNAGEFLVVSFAALAAGPLSS